jgi:hypothetical protein
MLAVWTVNGLQGIVVRGQGVAVAVLPACILLPYTAACSGIAMSSPLAGLGWATVNDRRGALDRLRKRNSPTALSRRCV